MGEVVAVIDVLTGSVVDFVVLFKYYHACALKQHVYDIENGKAAVCLWQRSEKHHGLRYIGFLLVMLILRPTRLLVKQTCTLSQLSQNHAHKRMGNVLMHSTSIRYPLAHEGTQEMFPIYKCN